MNIILIFFLLDQLYVHISQAEELTLVRYIHVYSAFVHHKNFFIKSGWNLTGTEVISCPLSLFIFFTDINMEGLFFNGQFV